MKKYKIDFRFGLSLLVQSLFIAVFCFLFSYAISQINNIFSYDPYHLFLLPLTLFIIQNIEMINRSGFAILVSSLFSHLAGASVGKEGAGVEFSSSLSAYIYDKLKGNEKDNDTTKRNLAVSIGKGSAFACLFQAPISGIIFAFKHLDIVKKSIKFDIKKGQGLGNLIFNFKKNLIIILPIIFVTLSTFFAHIFSIHPLRVNIDNTFPLFYIKRFDVYIALLFLILFSVSAFCLFDYFVKKLKDRANKNRFFAFILSFVVMGLLLFYYVVNNNVEVSGLSLSLISKAFGGDISYQMLIFKFILTILSIASGFKGGSVVPAIIISSSIGSLIASSFNLPCDVFSAFGVAIFFSPFSSSPLLSIAICCELFSPHLILYYIPLSLIGYYLYKKLF